MRKRTSRPSTKNKSQTLKRVYSIISLQRSQNTSPKRWLTSAGKQSVKSDKNHEKQIAGRSTSIKVRCLKRLGSSSLTNSMSTRGHARETSSVGEKKSPGRRCSMIAESTQNASSSFPNTRRRVEVTRFMPWQYPTAGLRLNPDQDQPIVHNCCYSRRLTHYTRSALYEVSRYRLHRPQRKH